MMPGTMRARHRSVLLATAPFLLVPVCWLPVALADGGTTPALGLFVASCALAAVGAVHLARRLHRASLRDPLTGLATRELFDEQAARVLARARRSGGAAALLCLDVDDFRLVKDQLGHRAGDELLREVARRLSSCTRAADVLARRGADEFLLLLSDLASAEHAREAASAAFERIRRALEPPVSVGGAEMQLTVSAGVSVFPDDAPDAETLERHADTAMFRAESTGGGLATYQPDAAPPFSRLSLAARLRRGLDHGELEVHFQPVCQLADGSVIGMEALARWRHPRRGMISPDEFIPVAEQTGLIDALGEWVLRQSCSQAATWRRLGLMPLLGINVSPRQLRRADFAERVAAQLDAHDVPPEQVVIELTETAWMLEADRMLPALRELKAVGVRLALDDFGAGYSSLSRLLELPVDLIKVDRTFLREVPERAEAVAVLTAITQLADASGCKVIVEGVETEAQRELLLELGCQTGQGFGLGRPAPPGPATALLLDRLEAGRRGLAQPVDVPPA
jgi:diguanylate cyclase (GGDEF)-like protein